MNSDNSLEWHSGVGGSGPTREERRKVWSNRFMVIWAGVGTLSFMTMVGAPTWLATWPSVVWVVHLLAMLVPVAVTRLLRKSKPVIRFPRVSAIRDRTQLAWLALVLIWAPVNLIGNLVTTAWGLGDDVATAQTTHILVRYKGDSEASYPVNGTVQTHSVRGFVTQSTARHPQVVVFAREHPDG